MELERSVRMMERNVMAMEAGNHEVRIFLELQSVFTYQYNYFQLDRGLELRINLRGIWKKSCHTVN